MRPNPGKIPRSKRERLEKAHPLFSEHDDACVAKSQAAHARDFLAYNDIHEPVAWHPRLDLLINVGSAGARYNLSGWHEPALGAQ